MKPARGFTLIELLVALVILSILAMMAWRAIDAMGKTQSITRQHADDLRRLQSALGQWNADLDALVDTRELTAIQFNGQVLRLTRRDPMETGLESRGIRVVAWALLNSPEGLRWSRWQSGPLRQRDELARAWQRAADWAGGRVVAPGSGDNTLSAPTADSAIALLPVLNWQLYYHRGEAWTNPQSAADVQRPTSEAYAPNLNLPNGVRLILQLAPGSAMQGTLQRDWVRPTLEAAP